jgi:hypothetical protein
MTNLFKEITVKRLDTPRVVYNKSLFLITETPTKFTGSANYSNTNFLIINFKGYIKEEYCIQNYFRLVFGVNSGATHCLTKFLLSPLSAHSKSGPDRNSLRMVKTESV